MNKLICFLCFVVIAGVQGGTAQDTTRVLFIGNSFMHYNDLPGLFSSMAAGAGEAVEVADHTPGGASVGDTIQGTFAHMYNPLVYDLIRNNEWDYLFLQDRQSRFAMGYGTFPGDSRVIEGHLKIRDSLLFYHPCAHMLWFAGFGPKAGYPPLAYSGEALIDSIYRNYLYLADTAGQVIVPIGPAFLRIMAGYPAIDLWGPDGEHPSTAGSWLIAGALFSTVFKYSPYASTANPVFPAPVDSLLKVTAWQTVQDSMAFTGLNTITPVITVSGNALSVAGFDSCRWYCNQIFLSSDTCTVGLTTASTCFAEVYDSQGCRYRTMPATAGGTVSSPGSGITGSVVTITPNPADESAVIDFNKQAVRLDIFDCRGKCRLSVSNPHSSHWLSLSGWTSGLYLVRVLFPDNTCATTTMMVR